MKSTLLARSVLSALCALALTTGATMADSKHDAVATGEREICHVCRVHEGEAEAEPVVASAEFDGHAYGFCSEKCRDTFLEAPESYLPPVFPRPAPAFVVRGLDGAEVSSDTFRGKTMLLDFWATWCQPCLDDLPKLTSLHERYAADGLVVLSVSIDEGDSAERKVKRAVKRRDAGHPVYFDSIEAPAWDSYKVRVVPSQFLVDAEGRIVAQWSGQIDVTEVEAEIARLLAAGTASEAR